MARAGSDRGAPGELRSTMALEAASNLGFICFFLRCADFARIVLAVRGSYASTRAGTFAVSIL